VLNHGDTKTLREKQENSVAENKKKIYEKENAFKLLLVFFLGVLVPLAALTGLNDASGIVPFMVKSF